MAVALEELYREIEPKFYVRLRTKSCFHKIIEWTHIVEDFEFIELLHGNELIFNTGINYHSDEWLMEYITLLNNAGAGGLVIALHNGVKMPQEIIDYCDQIKFPLFEAAWETPYMIIMRLFAEILLKNEQRETNLITAFRNAISHPDNPALYQDVLEKEGFGKNGTYTIIVLSCNSYWDGQENWKLKEIEHKIHNARRQYAVYEEKGRLVILAAGQKMDFLRHKFGMLCEEDPNVYVGIGTKIRQLKDIHRSYESAMTAYRLTRTAIASNILFYDELGVYKVISNLKRPETGDEFVTEVLGNLMAYDRKNNTDYMSILQAFFENECSVIHTAQAIYCHKNTLTYKINKIRELLNCDIMSNENLTRIMLALYFIKMRKQ